MPWPAVLLGALFSATVVVMIRTERDARRVTRQLEDFLRQIDERTDERTDNP
jgi:Flp pilus assembly protein TadB